MPTFSAIRKSLLGLVAATPIGYNVATMQPDPTWVADRVANGSVMIDANMGGGRVGHGAGFLVYKDDKRVGVIVTNAHVVDGAAKLDVTFSNNDKLQAVPLAVDHDLDLAVLVVTRTPKMARPLILANPDELKVGERIIVLGQPFGFSFNTTSGIVSSPAIKRDISGETTPKFGFDAPANPGNSGGPVANMQARIEGVATEIFNPNASPFTTPTSIGLGFAIPANIVRKKVEDTLGVKLG